MIEKRTASEAWRPQTFGDRNAKQIPDPVIEPLWIGTRVLAHVDDRAVELRDDAGRPVDRPPIADALAAAVDAASAVLDAYLTAQAARSGVGVHLGPTVELPTPGQAARQMLVGGGRGRRAEAVEALEDRVADLESAPSEGLVLVAVDLLFLDGDSLLDVPLLERKRLLDSVLIENELVRVGIHVRVPINPWLPTWRNLGFRSLAYKDANGRYRPGQRNDGWAKATIPRG